MIPLPSPLHPAVVHFPIVFLLVGMAVAVVAIFARRCCLPWIAAALLVAGAAGAVVATATGEEEAGTVGTISEAAEEILDEHEEWGEAARNAAIAAAVLAVAAAAAAKIRIAGRGLSVVAAIAALIAAYCVGQAGHYGGRLVYRHGVGINTAGADAGRGATASEAAPAAEREHGEKEHDD